MTEQQQPYLVETATPTAVEEYQFEPIKGYPMLQWKGKRPFRSTHYYPAQLREVHGPEVEGWRSKIFWGDNLQVMSHLLRSYRGAVSLAYIDPPFDSTADYKKTIRVHGQSVDSEASAFEEKQYTDIWTNDEYLQFIYERIVLLRELLADTGSVYLHCDYRKSHLIRCVLDEVFGPQSIRNEIVWKRTTARSDSTTYNHIHDTIWFYSKSREIIWNKQHTGYSSDYIRSNFREDERGRLFRDSPLTAPGLRSGQSGQEWRGVNPSSVGKGRHWAIPSFVKHLLSNKADNNPLQALDELDAIGRIIWAKDGEGRPNVIQYIDDLPGVELQSIWTDFGALSGNAIESEDYPTQKPEALLERVIRASSNPGDIVFDCFMGSGTTQAVAMKLGRRFIGADINLGAVQITTKRLIQVAQELAAAPTGQQQAMAFSADLEDDDEEDEAEAAPAPAEPTVFYTGFEVYNVNHYDIFRNPVEAKDLLLAALEVDKLPAGNLYDGLLDGRMVKVMPVNRIATRADLNELITGFDYRAFEKRRADNPNQPVEKITLVCMGHEPDLAAQLKREVSPYLLDVQVVDILRDKQDLQFKRDAEARVAIVDGWLEVQAFYPMNLLQKLSLQKEHVEEWRELVESVMIDWNYDGAVLTPAVVDIPEKNELVVGRYRVPEDAGTVRVKITDLLSESWEGEVL